MSYKEKYQEFYNSPAWKALRNARFYEANGLCEQCLKEGVIRPAREIHHIIPIEKDWSKRYDYDNLIALCPECHRAIHDRDGNFKVFEQIFDSISAKKQV